MKRYTNVIARSRATKQSDQKVILSVSEGSCNECNETLHFVQGDTSCQIATLPRCSSASLAMTKVGFVVFVLFVVSYLAGCAGPTEMTKSLEVKERVLQDIKATRQVPHRVVVAPVTIDKPPAKVDDKTEKYFTLNPEAMANELTVAFRNYGVFDKIEVLPETVTKRKDQIKEARKGNATHIMYVTIKQYRIYYIGNSSATMGNTFLWFFGGIPSFFTHDQMYGVQMKAHITYLDVATSKEFALPGLAYDAEIESSGSLSFLERGFNIAICIMPPQWCSVNWDKVEKLIRPELMKHLMAKLAEQTKTEFSRSGR